MSGEQNGKMLIEFLLETSSKSTHEPDGSVLEQPVVNSCQRLKNFENSLSVRPTLISLEVSGAR